MRLTDAGMLLLALLIVWSFYRAHRSPGNEINLFDLVMVDGRVSKMATVFMGAFALMTWMMVRLTVEGKMTEGYFGTYGAIWVAPMIARLFSAPPATAPEAK